MIAGAQTTLVIGASGLLGGTIARELMQSRGHSLALHYCTRRESCESLCAQALSLGLNARAYAADFTDPTAASALASKVIADNPKIDNIIWASGIVKDAPLLTLDEDALRSVLNVDLKAFMLTLKAFSRQFMKQKSGSVLALSSHAALSGRAGGTAYAMAHAGLLALVKSAAREWGSMGVRVNALVPPFVPESRMGQTSSTEFIAAAKAKRVLKCEVDGAAALARFAADILSNPAISGQVLVADSRIAV